MRWIVWIAVMLALGARADDAFPVFWQEKEKYVDLRTLASAYEAEATGPSAQRITLRNRWHELVFKVDGREVQVNGTVVWMHGPMEHVRGRWAIRAVDAERVIDPLVRPERHLQQAGHRVVVLDPGHGGTDTGARGARGLEEKRVVLDLARRVRSQLRAAGVAVYLTRESDREIALDQRARVAQRWGADLFVSIHLNSAGNAAAQGTETFALASAGYASTAGGFSNLRQPGNRHEGANQVLGYHVHRALTSVLASTDRGVKRSRFLVLKDAPCPAVLVECGFVSNRSEEERMLDPAYREKMAQGLARGILNYLNLARRARQPAS